MRTSMKMSQKQLEKWAKRVAPVAAQATGAAQRREVSGKTLNAMVGGSPDMNLAFQPPNGRFLATTTFNPMSVAFAHSRCAARIPKQTRSQQWISAFIG